MNQQQIEQWIAQNGGPGSVQYNSTSKRIRNPARMMTNADGTENPNYDPTALEWIDVAEESWTNSKTGATLRVSRKPDNSFDVLENKTADPNKPSANDDTPDKRNAAELQRQRERNAALPGPNPNGATEEERRGQDPAYETDAERRTRAQATIERQGRDAKDAETKARQTKIDEQNAATAAANARRADSAESRAVAEANRVGSKVTESTINGQHYTSITKTSPDGKTTTIEHFGPDGKPVAALPTDEKYAGLPADLPRYTPDLTKPGAGLPDYARQLDEYMAANPTKLSWQRRQEILTTAQASASSVANEFNTGAAILREQYQSSVSQRGQDMTQANSRATLGNTHHQNAVALIEKFAPYLGVEPGNAGKLFLGMMASQLATATTYGGMANVPREEMDPRLTAYANRTVGQATGAGRPASELGQPGDPTTAGNEAARQAAAAGQRAGMPAPIFAPQPPVDPNTAIAAGVNAAQAPAAGAQPILTPAVVNATTGTTHGLIDNIIGQPNPNVGQPGDPIMPPAISPSTGEPTGLAPLPGNGAFPQQPDMTQVPIPPASPGLTSLFDGAFPGQPTFSWRQRADAQRDYLSMPDAGAGIGNVLGMGQMGSPYGGGIDYGAPAGPAPMALQSQIPGLTPEIDAEARRQLAMGV